MTIALHAVRSVPKPSAVVVEFVTTESVADGLDDVPADSLDRAGFEGSVGQVFSWPEQARTRALVGVGDRDGLGVDEIRRAAAVVTRSFARAPRVAMELPAEASLDGRAARQALAEGVVLGAYTFDGYKSDAEAARLRRVDVVGSIGAKAQDALDIGAAIGGAQNLARDFVNEPGGSLTAPVFARRAASMAKSVGLTAKVWNESDIKKAGLGGVLGVNRGSDQPPRLVELTYQPKGKAQATLALVGKGITFDSGGLSIKPAQSMMTMKCDMGGAAAVIAAMSVLPKVAPKVRVRAFVPMTDNMTGGDATRPGDVLTLRNGKTIEVLNTDAEGRLILADALSLASEAKPDAIVDLATLTGACMVALGPKIAGVMGNDEGWIDQIEDAASAAGERVWHLPLPPDYRSQFDSTVADMKNIGGREGGALTAGLILQEFVGDGIAWAHIDIAGPAWSNEEDGETPKGGTGFGVRTLVELARSFRSPR